MKDVFKLALRSLTEGRSTVLVLVVEHRGSVPGTTGAAMVVSELGTAGTVGGGTAEYQMIEKARGFQGRAELVEIVHTSDRSGSLCSGSHTMAVVRLGAQDLTVVQRIADTLARDGFGGLSLGPDGLTFAAGVAGPDHFDESEKDWSFATSIGSIDTLYIVGGGHVGLALSRIMATLPFRIVVLDNRDSLPTMEANRYAHQTQVVEYGEISDHIAGGDRSWVVVMTFGHDHDASVVEALAEKRLRYLGLMGSSTKVELLFRDLLARGVPAEHLERISAPIGLAIGSHTPEEIAISIAAEIVKIRNL